MLVTSLNIELLVLAQLCRNRGDAENNFDELWNKWGWTGFTTADLYHCQATARHIALFQLVELVRAAGRFEREARGDHQPATALARRGAPGDPRRPEVVSVTPLTEAESTIRRLLTEVSRFLDGHKAAAEPLNCAQRWSRVWSRIFQSLMGGVELKMPQWVPSSV